MRSFADRAAAMAPPARLADGQLHVRLAGAEEHVADEDVRHRQRGARAGADFESERAAGVERRQGRRPSPRRVRAGRGPVAGERDRDLVAGARRPPDRDRLAALHDGVILEERSEYQR